MLTLGTANVALSAVNGARRVFTVYRDLAEDKDAVPDGFLLWCLVQSLEQPMLLAMRLQTRYQSLPFVDSAVTLTKRVLQRCEAVVDEHADSDSDGDDVPDGVAGWIYWFSKKKSDNQLSELVPLLCRDLQSCLQALQLAFAALQIESQSRLAWQQSPPSGASGVANWRAPVCLDVAAAESARHRFHEFEYGRTSQCLIGSGNVFALRQTPAKRAPGAKSHDAHLIGYHYLYLRRITDNRTSSGAAVEDHPSGGEVMVLSLLDSTKAAATPLDFDGSIDLYFSPRTRVKRLRASELSGLIESDATRSDEDVVYNMSGDWGGNSGGTQRMFLHYESANGVALEEFEALVMFAFCTCQSTPLSSLAGSVDLDSEVGRTHLMLDWEHVVGPLATQSNFRIHDSDTSSSTILNTPKQSTYARGSSSYGDQVDVLKMGKLNLNDDDTVYQTFSTSF